MKAKRTQTNLKKLKKLFPPRAGHLDMFEAMQKTVYSVGFNPPAVLHKREIGDGLRSGKPLLDISGRTLDRDAFMKALGKLFKLLSGYDEKSEAAPDEEDSGKFSALTEDRLPGALMDDYLLAAVEPLSVHADSLNLSPAELVSCCQQAARPQLVALREANAEVDEMDWRLGHCPYCGALPCFAETTPAGIHSLRCPNCFAEYRFSRHYCPGCGHAGLVTLRMEAWPHLSMEKCPECETYLKTWNHGSAEPPCPFPYLEIVTGEVDEAADLQGLKRLSLGVMGF
jgi:formate dehydrogenase maturation protein FdhE